MQSFSSFQRVHRAFILEKDHNMMKFPRVRPYMKLEEVKIDIALLKFAK